MTRTTIFVGLLAAATGLFALGASAQDAAAPQQEQAQTGTQWMSIADLSTKLQSQGYTVEGIERDDGVWEVEMTDANGMRVEAYLHPATGEPIRDRDRLRERDDEDTQNRERGDD